MSEKNFVVSTGLTIAEGGNIDGVTNLNVSANIVMSGGDIANVGNVTAGHFVGNGSQITGVTASTGNITFDGENIGSTTDIVNIVTSNGSTEDYTWSFGTDGDLLFPRNSAGNTDPYLTITGGANPRILSEDASQAGPANLEITALNTVFTGLTGQKVTIYPDDGEIAADSNLQIWTNAGNVNEQSWTFDTTGNLTTSSNLIIGPSPAGGSSILQYDSALQVVGEGANAIMVMGWAANTNAPDSIAVVGFNTPYTNGASNVQIAVGNNATTVNYWTFANNGTTTFPTLTVDLHNGGNQAGQVLQFGDGSQQAIITGPTPAVDNNAQRLIIQGQAGNGTGEGGDVYLWGGDAEFNGGDIKIYAGDADNVASGSGGYVNIEGGSGFDYGGYASLRGGQSNNGQGAYAQVVGGYGASGGDANITGGQGYAGTGGAVNITGGISGNGLAEYGNVNVTAGTSTWTFDNTGNLTLPGGGIVYGNPYTPSGAPGNTITLQPAGSGTITDQRLLVYPTAGDGDHIHLTSGNLYQTELFLGSDNLYVKLSASGNIVVNANDGAGNTAQWNFGTDGTTIFPGNITGSGASPAPSISGFDNVNSVTISASGNVTGDYILGNGSQLTNLPAPAVAQDITSVGDMSIMTYDGNIKYVNYATVEPATGTIKSSGNISAIGNVQAGNVRTAGLVSATGNVTSGNVLTAGLISATGTITSAANIIGGNAIISGAATTGINAVLAGPTFTPLANTVAGFTGNVNSYTQVTFQNKNSGADATADFILTADNGSDTVNYSDFGIINSGYDNATPTNSLGNIVFAADTYLYAQGNTGNASQSGGNLAIGTTVPGKTVKIFAGGVTSNSIIANISNTGVSVTGNVTASNFIGNISITGNVTGTSPNVSLVAGSYTYTFDNTGILTLPAPSTGNEGGEIAFTQAANSTLGGNTVVIDQYVDRIRFFESGGNVRGAYIDLTQAADGVGTLLNNRASGIVNAGVDVTLGNLKARIPTSGNRSLQVSTVSGSYSVYGSAQYTAGGTIGGTNIVSGFAVSVTTTPAYLASGNNFGTAGDAGQWIIMDTSAGLAWRISFIIGASFNNNMISIERLV